MIQFELLVPDYGVMFTGSHPSQVPRASETQEHNDQPRSDDLLLRHLESEIPDQVSDAVEGVEGEWESDEEFRGEFCGDGPCGEGGC